MHELPRDSVPALTARQMREVDRVMTDILGIDLPRMMETAGRHLARLAADRFLGGDPGGRSATVLAGKGGNGGGALVAARRLLTWGAGVTVSLARPRDELTPTAAQQLDILNRMGVDPSEEGLPEEEADVVLDGLIGYSLNGAPLGRTRDLIRWTGAQPAPVLSLDVPSGLDATSGGISGDVVCAAATLTLALPKLGLLATARPECVGDLYLGDIGVPPRVYEAVGVEVGPVFARGDLLRIV